MSIGTVVRVIAVINLFPYGMVQEGETMTVMGLTREDAIVMRLDTPHPELPIAWNNSLWLEPGLTEWTDRVMWPDGKSLKTVYNYLQNLAGARGSRQIK